MRNTGNYQSSHASRNCLSCSAVSNTMGLASSTGIRSTRMAEKGFWSRARGGAAVQRSRTWPGRFPGCTVRPCLGGDAWRSLAAHFCGYFDGAQVFDEFLGVDGGEPRCEACGFGAVEEVEKVPDCGAVPSDRRDGAPQHVLVVVEPSLPQLKDRHRLKTEDGAGAGFELAVRLRRECPRLIKVGSHARAASDAVLVVAQVPDASAQVASNAADAKGLLGAKCGNGHREKPPSESSPATKCHKNATKRGSLGTPRKRNRPRLKRL